MFPRKTLLAGWRCIWKLFCLEQKVEMFKHITWNEHIWLIGWKVLAKLWWQRLASSEIPCFVLSPPTTYTLHLFTLFLHLSSFSSQLYRTLAFSLQVSTSREPQFSSTVANFFRLRKPSDTFLPDNQHPTAVSQYSTTHRFLFFFHKRYPRILRDNQHPTAVSLYSATHRFLFNFTKDFEESYMTSNTHIRPYSTLSFSKEVSFPRVSSFGLLFCTSWYLDIIFLYCWTS